MLGSNVSSEGLRWWIRGVSRCGTLCALVAALALTTGCPPAADECTVDTAATDCDDTDVCTTDTCEAAASGQLVCQNAAIDGCCTADADCATGEVCDATTNTCTPTCTADAD
ncbi:MAG: hypothetical protein ACE5E6_09810, partial [Phycisphaerae bacterium]